MNKFTLVIKEYAFFVKSKWNKTDYLGSYTDRFWMIVSGFFCLYFLINIIMFINY